MKDFLLDGLKIIAAAICSFSGFIWGEFNGMFYVLIAMIVLDYISGVFAAYVSKTISSAVGAKGIAKKVFMLLVVAIANMVDVNVIGSGHVLKTVVILFYIANEAISLIENAGYIGVPVPDKLMQVLKQLRDKNNDDSIK